jgi:hypothetical protein
MLYLSGGLTPISLIRKVVYTLFFTVSSTRILTTNIHQVGIISNYKCPELNTVTNSAEKIRYGWIFEPWGEHTLARFIAYMTTFNYSHLKTSPFVLLPYLSEIQVTDQLTKYGLADEFYK